MEKIGDIISGFLGKKGKGEEDPEENITEIIKDKFVAALILKLNALTSGFDVIEAESNAKFTRAMKEMGITQKSKKRLFVKDYAKQFHIFDESTWTKLAEDSVKDIKDLIKQLNELKIRPIQHSNNEEDPVEYSIDYTGIARVFTEMLNREVLGDSMVQDREERISKIYFNGNAGLLRRLKNLCSECFERVITSDWEGVVWRENEKADEIKLNEMEHIFDRMAEKCCEYYGQNEQKVIPFPTAMAMGDK
jgi:hypothetical protein